MVQTGANAGQSRGRFWLVNSADETPVEYNTPGESAGRGSA